MLKYWSLSEHHLQNWQPIRMCFVAGGVPAANATITTQPPTAIPSNSRLTMSKALVRHGNWQLKSLWPDIWYIESGINNTMRTVCNRDGGFVVGGLGVVGLVAGLYMRSICEHKTYKDINIHTYWKGEDPREYPHCMWTYTVSVRVYQCTHKR